MKKTVKLTIHADVIDCYLYAGYMFLFFTDGRIVYVNYHRVIHLLKDRYPQYSSLIDLIFLHNEYSKSTAAKMIFSVKEIHDVMTKLWVRAADEIAFEIDYGDIEDYCEIMGEWQSLPLDIRMYAMRVYMGCRDGLYESNLQMDDRYGLHPTKFKRCFDGKTIAINTNYSSIVVSADWDGLYAGCITDMESALRLNENKTLAERSIRTGWAGTDMINYDTSSSFVYLNNASARLPKSDDVSRSYKRADYAERVVITDFGISTIDMTELFDKTSINPCDIIYSFNSSERSFFFLRDGSFKNATIRTKRENGEELFYISKNLKEEKFNKTKRIMKPLSSTLVSNGSVVEFFDRVILFQEGSTYVLSEEPVIKVRSYLSSRNYRDLLSIVSEGKVNIHSIYTLDLINSSPAFGNSSMIGDSLPF